MTQSSTNDSFSGLNESWFKYLLATLVAVFFLIPVLSELVPRPFPLLGRILYVAVFLMILTGAVGLSAPGRPVFYSGLAIGILVMLMNILFLVFQESGLMVAHHLLMILLLGYFTIALTRYLFLCRTVTQYTIYAALSSYLMLALIWALLYGTVEMLQPGSFNVPLAIDPGGHLSDPGIAVPFPTFYFSIVTITTLGYGDITPVGGAARTLASAEALTGQMFIAITLARLVAIFSSKSTSSQ